MESVFWDSEWIIRGDFLSHGVTINAQNYSSLLRNGYHQAIRKKISRNLSKKFILLHENIRPHTENWTKATLAAVGREITNHLPYSPDFFFLFGLWDYRHCGHSWPIVPASGDNEDDCGEHDWQGKPKFSENAPAPLLSITKSHVPTRVWTRAAAVGSRRLTAWAMARPTALT
jgi:hypothetical protein